MRVPKSDSDLAEKVVGLALTATAALVLNYGPEIKDKLKDDVMPAAKAKWNAWFKNKEDDSAAIEAGAEETAADAVPCDLTDGSGKGPDLGPQRRHPEGRFGHLGRFGRPGNIRRPAGGHESPEVTPR
jgi:hypothetical protein